MSIFGNPFFSVAGQKERVVNVGRTIRAGFTGEEISSFTSSNRANRFIETVAENPLATAFVGAVGVAPRGALAAAKAGFSVLSPTAKVAVAVSPLIIIPALANDPELATKPFSAPREIAKAVTDVQEIIADPTIENIKDAAKESPVILGTAAATGGYVLGRGIFGLGRFYTNERNRRRITAAENQINNIIASGAGLVPDMPTPTTQNIPDTPMIGAPSSPQSQPLTPETQVLGKEVTTSSPRKASRRRVVAPKAPSVRVQVLNQNTFIGA